MAGGDVRDEAGAGRQNAVRSSVRDSGGEQNQDERGEGDVEGTAESDGGWEIGGKGGGTCWE